tara:strand:+ start:51 stop:617 length:567 start_codon:yes stop_codon:yes gene_type:complete
MITETLFKENLETLYNSLERKERELNKVSSISFYCLKENLENRKEIQDFIMDLHNNEAPNDWRYDIIHSLLDQLLHQYDVNNEDEAYEHIDTISDSLVNVYNYGLAKWLCEDVSRGYFEDLPSIEGSDTSIYGIIMKRQYEEIYTMASKIINYCQPSFDQFHERRVEEDVKREDEGGWTDYLNSKYSN